MRQTGRRNSAANKVVFLAAASFFHIWGHMGWLMNMAEWCWAILGCQVYFNANNLCHWGFSQIQQYDCQLKKKALTERKKPCLIMFLNPSLHWSFSVMGLTDFIWLQHSYSHKPLKPFECGLHKVKCADCFVSAWDVVKKNFYFTI